MRRCAGRVLKEVTRHGAVIDADVARSVEMSGKRCAKLLPQARQGSFYASMAKLIK